MKCSKGHSNSDSAKFCSFCGEKLPEMKTCLNPACANFGKYNIPIDADFCPDCGTSLQEVKTVDSNTPFPERHPEYNLVPYCEFRYKEDLTFFFNKKPHFIENGIRSEGTNYFFIAKDEKLGILRYIWHKHWYGDEHINTNIIPMQYEKIENENPYFICYKGNRKFYFDRDGKKIK